MQRQPLEPTDDRPTCYGISHAVLPDMCEGCGYAQACEVSCRYWTDILSLTEALRKAEDTFESRGETEDIAKLYMDLCHKHYGRRFNAKAVQYLRKGQGADYLIRMISLCESEGIDPGVWITANMVMQFNYAKKAKYGFQPWMLIGDRAKARYNIYVRKANRKRNVSVDAFDHKTKAALREVLVLDESTVGLNYVAAYFTGESISWRKASEGVETSREWQRKAGGKRLWKLVELQAAIDVAAHFDPALPSMIGFTEFSWSEFAIALARLFDTPSRQTSDVADVPGVLWGTHR